MDKITDHKVFIDKIKLSLVNQINDLLENKKNLIDGLQFCKNYAEVYDEVIRKVYLETQDNKSGFAVAACGSYGRNELCFKSDIDIVFLTGDTEDQKINDRIKMVIKGLWDTGIDIAYTIRNFQDCINTYSNDHPSFTALLETRYICGDPFIYVDFINSFHQFLEKEKDFFFVYSVIEGIEFRHNKFGNSVKLLEPNIKNSAGSLRDLHDLFWIFKSLYPNNFTEIGINKTYYKRIIYSGQPKLLNGFSGISL